MKDDEDIPNVIVNKYYLEQLQKENEQLKKAVNELLEILKEIIL
ncbi:MAG TPA: hypothetical protein V6C58_04570 [Allocoleopsis sp.]